MVNKNEVVSNVKSPEHEQAKEHIKEAIRILRETPEVKAFLAFDKAKLDQAVEESFEMKQVREAYSNNYTFNLWNSFEELYRKL